MLCEKEIDVRDVHGDFVFKNRNIGEAKRYQTIFAGRRNADVADVRERRGTIERIRFLFSYRGLRVETRDLQMERP